MNNAFNEKISSHEINQMKGHLGKRFNLGKFKLDGENYDTNYIGNVSHGGKQYLGKEALRQKLLKFTKGVSSRERSKYSVNKMLEKGGLKISDTNLKARKRLMDELFPDDKRPVPQELKELDVPEDYGIRYEKSGEVTIRKDFSSKKLVTTKQGIDGHTSALVDKANRGFALGKGSTGNGGTAPAGFALSNKAKL